jgi:MoxR-like ATPase
LPIPNFKGFIDPLLRVLRDHPEGLRAAAAHELVAERLELTDAEMAERLPSGAQAIFRNRNGWAQDRLKRAGLTESPRTGHWRITPAGMALLAERPSALTEDDLLRITDIKEGRQAAPWRERLTAFRADSAWVQDLAASSRARARALPELNDLLARFLEGRCSLREFADEFGKRSRREWDVFGAKGMIGAGGLSQLAKRRSDDENLQRDLRRWLRLPSSPEAAAAALDEFVAHLTLERRGDARMPVPALAPFLASLAWYAQDPEQWPPAYASARAALEADGLYERNPDHSAGTDYLDFRSAFSELAGALELSIWDLDFLLHWTQRGRSAAPEPTATNDEQDAERPRVWLIALGRNADQFESCYREGVIAIGWGALGDLMAYSTLEELVAKLQSVRADGKNPVNDALACWQFVHEMRIGDAVYVKRGRDRVIAHGVVRSEYRHVPGRPVLPNVREVTWKVRGEWRPSEKQLSMKTLTEIGRYPGLLTDIRAAIGEEPAADTDPDDTPETAEPIAPYALADADKDLFLGRERLEELVSLLRYKKNMILQGPPGVGKTFVATRLAYLLIKSKNKEQIARVQFHPSYSYEDFVQGLRPVESGGFARQDGPLLRFCKDALEDQDSDYVLIIDEINRGNISKILGELLSLIEADKRSPEYALQLAYSRDNEPPFHVPPNLHIIGMMNTADRSIALIDYALRRRFVFVDIEPAFETPAFASEMARLGVPTALRESIAGKMKSLNEQIRLDPGLGRGFEIGHSYFCVANAVYDDAWFSRIVEFEIGPLLREYWCDNPTRIEQLEALLYAEG